MKKNEEYIVDIIDNGFQGEGIAKIDGIPIFIDKAIKGEKVKIKILKVKDYCSLTSSIVTIGNTIFSSSQIFLNLTRNSSKDFTILSG